MMPTRAGHAARPGVSFAVVGSGLAALAVVLWAVGMTVWQPLTEPVGPWSERLPGDNTYWARDLRFLALTAMASGLVLAGGGRRPWALSAVLLAGGALAADVAVDRADPTGTGATVLLVALGWLAVGITAASAVRRDAVAAVVGPGRVAALADPYRAAGVVGRDRAVLTGVACVAAVSALVAVLTRSPTDQDPELGPAALVTGLLLLATTVAGALAAAPDRERARIAVAVGTAVVGGVGLLLVRLTGSADRRLPAAVLGAVLLVGVTLLTRPWPGGRPAWRWHALLVPVTLVVPLALLSVAQLVSAALRPGAPLTALAGNSPIAGPGSDALPSLAGLLAGLGTALLLTRPAVGPEPGLLRSPGHRPDSPADGSSRPASAERR
ncbi:hypothetical protein [Micromonospora sp. NBC_00421]|uniref:hypothetical protein n=1 Tax=Micromonospora sp. NBC_00421 TaxID=2975976 RepID=UPI002E1DB09C